MLICIDESGAFVCGKETICCSGALAIPETSVGALEKDFRALKLSFGIVGEAHGRELCEEQVEAFLKLLSKYDAIFDGCAMLMSDNPDFAVRQHQLDNKDAIEKATDVKWVKVAETLAQLSTPLYAQYLLLLGLVPRILQSTLYCAPFKYPEELGNFKWILDTKGNQSFHDVFKELVIPIFIAQDQCRPEDQRLGLGIGLNYEAFMKSYGVASGTGINMDAIFSNISFEDSQSNIGIELADIATSAFSRAARGTLEKPSSSWHGLGCLMRRKQHQSVLISAYPLPNIPTSDNLRIKERFNSINRIWHEKGMPLDVIA